MMQECEMCKYINRDKKHKNEWEFCDVCWEELLKSLSAPLRKDKI
jgi:hypothetical protein